MTMQQLKDRIKAFFESDPYDPNRRFTRRNIVIGVIAVIGLILLILLISALMGSDQNATPKHSTKQKPVHFVKVHNDQFSEKDAQSALYQEESTIDSLKKQLNNQQETIQKLRDDVKTMHHRNEQTRNQFVDKLEKEKQQFLKKLKKQSQKAEQASKKADNTKHQGNKPQKPYNPFTDKQTGQKPAEQGALGKPQAASFKQQGLRPSPGIQVVSLREQQEKEKHFVKNTDNYVPSGTFCRAVLLGGADADAGVNGSSDSSPILFKVMNNCHLPNGKKSDLKGALITASTYGKISSSRGKVRLDSLSLVRDSGQILDIPVQGTAFDLSGKAGIRGKAILRNSQILQTAGISGAFSGLGEAAQSFSRTQSVSPLGVTDTVNPEQVPAQALGAGMDSAFGKLSDYYIKLAEQYSPVIALNAGSVVDIVFLKGFPLQDKQQLKQYSHQVDKDRKQKNRNRLRQAAQQMTTTTTGGVSNQLLKKANQQAQKKLGQDGSNMTRQVPQAMRSTEVGDTVFTPAE